MDHERRAETRSRNSASGSIRPDWREKYKKFRMRQNQLRSLAAPLVEKIAPGAVGFAAALDLLAGRTPRRGEFAFGQGLAQLVEARSGQARLRLAEEEWTVVAAEFESRYCGNIQPNRC